jgi:hypothetical protein
MKEVCLFLFYLAYMVCNLSAIPQRVFGEMSGLRQLGKQEITDDNCQIK